MEQKDLAPVDYAPLNLEDYIRLDRNVIASAVERADRFLGNLYESILKTRQYASMMIAVFSAVLAALVGCIFANPETQLIVPLIIGLLANVAPIFLLVKGLFYKRTLQFSGAKADSYLRKEAMEWIRSMKEWDEALYDEEKYFNLLHLQDLHYWTYQNRETQKSHVLWYRRALYCAVASYSLWIAALIAFVLI